MSPTDDGAPGIFALERFDWAGPDRLEIEGTFTEEPPESDAEPLLVVYGDDGMYELRRVWTSRDEPLPGEQWQAAFAWQDPPAAFTAAELVLGDVRIDLAWDADHGVVPEPAEPLAAQDAGGGATRLHLEAELVAVREQCHALAQELDRTRAELDRARQDLEAERDGRAQDAVRFRDGLATVERAAADELQAARAHLEAAEESRAQAELLRAELVTADAREAQLRERVNAASDDVERALASLLEAGRDPDGTAGRQ